MIRRIFISGLLAAALLPLAACGSKDPPAQGPLYETLGLSREETVLSVDNREVPAWRYLYALAYGCSQLESAYQEAGLAVDWDAATESGVTLGEYARQQAVADAALYATVENWAVEYGIQLTAEEEAVLDESAADWTALPYFQALTPLELGEAEARELLADGCLYRRLLALFSTAGSALAPTPEALDAFSREAGYLTLDWIFLPAGTDRESAQQQAGALFSQLNTSADVPTAFSTLADQYSRDPSRAQYPAGRTLLPGNGVLPADVEAAGQALGENQWSGILESTDGFYLLLRKPLDTAPVHSDYFDHLLLDAAGNADIQTSEVCAALDVSLFYETLRGAAADIDS